VGVQQLLHDYTVLTKAVAFKMLRDARSEAVAQERPSDGEAFLAAAEDAFFSDSQRHQAASRTLRYVAYHASAGPSARP
jgi:hypothetical protein